MNSSTATGLSLSHIRRHGVVGVRVLLRDGQKELEFRRKLFLRVQAIREVDTANSAIRVYLNSQNFNVVRSIGSSGKIRQIELNLIPTFQNYDFKSKPLQIWDKKVRNGHIKRITDPDIQSSVLEIMGTNNVSTTFIQCPASKKNSWN